MSNKHQLCGHKGQPFLHIDSQCIISTVRFGTISASQDQQHHFVYHIFCHSQWLRFRDISRRGHNEILYSNLNYIARKLCGITLLMQKVCLTASGNLFQCQFEANIRNAICNVFMVGHHFVSSRPVFFFGGADFHDCPKGSVAHLCWSHSAMSHCCM